MKSAGRGWVIPRMEIDSIRTMGAKGLLDAARARLRRDPQAARVLVTEAVGAALFAIAAGATALIAPAWRMPSVTRLATVIVAYIIALLVRFPGCLAWTR